MQLKLTLTIPWAKRANDIDLHLACDVPGTVLLAVPKRQVEQLEVPEVPVRVVAGLGDFELGVKETGLQVPFGNPLETLNFDTFYLLMVIDERTKRAVSWTAGSFSSGHIWDLGDVLTVLPPMFDFSPQISLALVTALPALQVQITYKASTSGARFHRHSRSLEVSMEMEDW